MITPAQYNSLAQKAHFAAGLAAVFGAAALFGKPLYGAVGVIAFAAVKEFWYDYRYETPEIRGSSAEDFFFYCLGALAAYLPCVTHL